jgi:hypothetical protein
MPKRSLHGKAIWRRAVPTASFPDRQPLPHRAWKLRLARGAGGDVAGTGPGALPCDIRPWHSTVSGIRPR